jgi:hypothetical protein
VQLLKVMLTAYRPLREEEVSSATGLSLEDAAIDLLIDRCASFVRKQGASIEPVHQSARDFLVQETQPDLSSYGRWEHGEIAPSCLHYLSQQLKVNLVDLPQPDSERGSMSSLPHMARKGPLDRVNYAATSWAQHLADALPNAVIADALEDQGKVVAFLRAKLLNSHLKYRSKRDIKTSRAATTFKYSVYGRKLVSNVGSFIVDGVAQGIQHDCDSTSLDDL